MRRALVLALALLGGSASAALNGGRLIGSTGGIGPGQSIDAPSCVRSPLEYGVKLSCPSGSSKSVSLWGATGIISVCSAAPGFPQSYAVYDLASACDPGEIDPEPLLSTLADGQAVGWKVGLTFLAVGGILFLRKAFP